MQVCAAQHIEIKQEFTAREATAREPPYRLKTFNNVDFLVFDDQFFVIIMKPQDLARLLFQKIGIHMARAHHHHPGFKGLARAGRIRQLNFGGFDLGIQGHKPQITALSRDQMVTKIDGKTHANNRH